MTSTDPGWRLVEGRWLWWDGTQYTTPSSFGWRLVEGRWLWWDGTRYTARAERDGPDWRVEQVSAPGWHEDPTEPGTFRYWNGTQWTNEVRRPASRSARLLMLALVVTGCAVLFWGRYVLVHNPVSSYPRDMREYYCTDENIVKIADGLWVPWFVLMALGLAGVAVWQQLGPHDRWLKFPAILGAIAATVTCPIFLVFLQGADCGM